MPVGHIHKLNCKQLKKASFTIFVTFSHKLKPTYHSELLSVGVNLSLRFLKRSGRKVFYSQRCKSYPVLSISELVINSSQSSLLSYPVLPTIQSNTPVDSIQISSLHFIKQKEWPIATTQQRVNISTDVPLPYIVLYCQPIQTYQIILFVLSCVVISSTNYQ